MEGFWYIMHVKNKNIHSFKKIVKETYLSFPHKFKCFTSPLPSFLNLHSKVSLYYPSPSSPS